MFCEDLGKFKATQSATIDTIEENEKHIIIKVKSSRLELDSSWILEPNVQYLHVLDSTMTDCPPSTSCKASAIPDSHETRTGLAAGIQVTSLCR